MPNTMAESGDINAIPETVINMYSEVLYEMYKPSINFGRQGMIYREIIISLCQDRYESEEEYVRIHTGSSTETLLMDDDFETDLDVMTYKKGQHAILCLKHYQKIAMCVWEK